MKRALVAVIVLLLAAGTVSAGKQVASSIDPSGPIVEAATVRAPGHFDRAAYEQQRQQVHAWLVAEQVEAGLASPISVHLSKQELLDIESGECEGCKGSLRALRVGMVKPVSADVELSDVRLGAKRATADGGFVWTAAVRSEGAGGLRVHFTDFWLPQGFELYLYTPEGEAFGPYVEGGPLGTGEFWSHTVGGEMALLQLRRYGPALTKDLHDAYFTIADVGHVGQRFYVKYNDPAVHPLCSFNAACTENAACYSGTAISDAKYAVAHMQYVKRPYIYFCSGGLLNNTGGGGVPYFLSANHCISRDREAATLEAYFQFWTSCNSPECPDYNQITSPRTLGATVMATNKTSDFTLMQLSEPAPTGSAFLGWTNQAVAYTHGAELYRIAHPAGAPQAYSHHTVDVNKGTCSSWPRGDWIYSYDVVGATEGGSSGSPVLNAAGQVVGQLSGGCGTNVYEECDNDANATVDGAFAAYYDQVASWLDPGGCPDADNDGYQDAACGGNDCDDTNEFINPGMAENCSNGIDDDCDNLIDGDDPECSICPDADGDSYADAACGGNDCDDTNEFINPGMAEDCTNGIDDDCDNLIDDADSDCGTCLLKGEACSSNDECCSLRCHPVKGTCK